MENIANKTVIITGASSGLGAETARHLVQNGAHVILGARRLDRLHALADELGISHDHCVQTDVADLAQVQALAQRALDLYGRIDVLLNNAGVMPLSLLEKLKIDEWNQIIDINIRGVLRSPRRKMLPRVAMTTFICDRVKPVATPLRAGSMEMR